MYRFYKITLIAALLAASSALTATAITAEPRSTPHAGENGSIVVPTSSTGILSQCGDYFTFNPDKSFYGVVPDDYKEDFIPVPKMIVPVYGFMVDIPFDVEEAMKVKQGGNPYQRGHINRALWEGHTFIWIDKDVESETFDFIKAHAKQWNATHNNKLIPLTWTDEDKELPAARDFAFSSWETSQSCMSFSVEALDEFLSQAKMQNSGRDTAKPPMAKLTSDGKLPKQGKV